jgi:endonuclease-3
MQRAERYNAVLEILEKQYPEAETELIYRNPFELLVAVILSAQCTDKRVNLTTPALFKAYPTAKHLMKAEVMDVFNLIRSISYPNNKAKHLVAMAQRLVNIYHEVVPSQIEELVTLPGVGRKTANVIASVVYELPHMAVDTHVFRVASRIGLTYKATTPLAAEKQLVKFIPNEKIHKAHHWLILHGRYVCVARNPKCDLCRTSIYCKYFKKLNK